MASKTSHIRSISLPSRSHPTTQRVEEVLNKIKTSELSSDASESICYGLCRLAELYQCVDELLNLPSTIQALSQQGSQKLGDEFMDRSLRILDICGITKEIVSQFKENLRDLQSSLRRRTNTELSLNNYTCFRKKMKRDAKRSMAALKQIDQGVNGIFNLEDECISALIRALREVTSTSIAVFQSVLMFLSAQSSKPKTSKWSLVSKLVNKSKMGSCEEQQESQNEVENVDSAVESICKNDQENEKIQLVQNRLEILETGIDGVENGLEGLFRCLIRSRTSLLNIFSC
ncbi:OLC1v1011157C1 [Oldenlandia corymbosa var. corymbosa]|uniref:OLC1v1011157C1 n=1 Tax=Oldenlandia corymbosa var. corymbosa TaxID=529605 RepID=A0AAV1DT77_OLDCO|nr:OLC1v1011157C1 [Oldenlandia corymbosa var. corymbosa]